MVVTDLPATSNIATPHERTASPSRCTVHAPHSATPQPNFVPVRPSSSRRYHISGIDGSPSKDRCCPFTLRLTMVSSLVDPERALLGAKESRHRTVRRRPLPRHVIALVI